MRDASREELVNLIDRLVGEYTASRLRRDWDVPGLLMRVVESSGRGRAAVAGSDRVMRDLTCDCRRRPRLSTTGASRSSGTS